MLKIVRSNSALMAYLTAAIWISVGVIAWTDSLDLSDDLPAVVAVAQSSVESLDDDDSRKLAVTISPFAECQLAVSALTAPSLLTISHGRAGDLFSRPLHQRHHVYRI